MLFDGLMHEETWLKRFLSTRAMELLGKSSYVFYLIHMGIFTMAINHYVSNNFLILVILLIGASILLHLYVEEPLHKLIAGRGKAYKERHLPAYDGLNRVTK